MKLVRLSFILIGLCLITTNCKPNLPALAVKSQLPAGLIYYEFVPFAPPTFRLVGPNGYATKLTDAIATPMTQYGMFDPAAAISFSADGTRVLSFENSLNSANTLEMQRGNIVMQNLKTNIRTQLTNDPNHVNTFPHWWPGNSRTILFSASRPGPPTFSNGSLGIVNTDGSDYRIYEDILFRKAVPLADGKTLLYTLQSDPATLRVMTLDGQTRILDLALYPGFNLVEKQPEKQPSERPSPSSPSSSCIAPDGLLGKGNSAPDGSLVSWSVCLNQFTFIHWQDPAKTFSISLDFSVISEQRSQLPVWSSDSQYFTLFGANPTVATAATSTTITTTAVDTRVNTQPRASTFGSLLIFDRTGKLIHHIEQSEFIGSQGWRPGTHELVYTLLPNFMVAVPLPNSTPVPTPAPESQPEVVIFNVDTNTSTDFYLTRPIVIQSWVSTSPQTK